LELIHLMDLVSNYHAETTTIEVLRFKTQNLDAINIYLDEYERVSILELLIIRCEWL
jgi:hypothetical protein